MKSIPKFIRRFISILLLSSFLLLILNVVFLFLLSSKQTSSGAPYTTADELAANLKKSNNTYYLDDTSLQQLNDAEAWAIFVDNDTHKVVWRSENTPEGIPNAYSLSDISDITLGYINDYPTYVGNADDGIMIVGYPKKRYWKSMFPTWDYHFIANLPKTVLIWLIINIAAILLIYIIANTRLLKSIKPITHGIQMLPTKEPVHIKEKGVLSEISKIINQTSDILQSQQYELRKKETARANWIAGVSHDIRTPLSMVMGYAGQLAECSNLEKAEKDKAVVIVNQSKKIKNLINDLNLASKLEYNMQPAVLKKENAVSILRQVAVEFINNDIEKKYPIEWTTNEELTLCYILADSELLKRAISNLIQNSMNHNENGCTIYLNIIKSNKICTICVEDDGIGASTEQIEKLNNTPHYMVCDQNTTEQRHGLGLLIVKQIAVSHGGTVKIEQSHYGGLCVKITLPVLH